MPEAPRFAITPDEQQLAAVERDLRFHPSPVTAPRTLTAAQLESFDREGYLRPIRIFEDEEITAIRRYFDDLLARTVAAGGDSYSISSAHLRYGRVYDLLTYARIVACVRDLLGESVVGWGSHFFCKMPGDGKAVAWHQDASYWPLTPSKTVTVWLAIDRADRQNGCMRFIASSHWVGHLTYRPSDAAEHNVLTQTIENPEQYGAIVNDELEAGEISIHADLLLHGSEANESNRRRCGLTLRYCTADVRAHNGWNAKGVVLVGTDADGHWANPPRPAVD